MSAGLLLIRLVVGVLLAGHGTQTRFGWLGGYGIEGTGQFFEGIAFGRAEHLLRSRALPKRSEGCCFSSDLCSRWLRS